MSTVQTIDSLRGSSNTVSSDRIFRNNFSRVKLFSIILAVVAILLASIPVAQLSSNGGVSSYANSAISAITGVETQDKAQQGSSDVEAADAFKFLCPDMGTGMDSQTSWKGFFVARPAQDAGNRQLSVQEAFAANLSVPAYYGDGKGGTLVVDTDGAKRSGSPGNFKDKEVQDRVGKLRANAGTCIMGGLQSGISSLLLQFSGMVSSLAGLISSYTFNSSFICSASDAKNCMNMTNILGGGANEKGILSALGSSIFAPLAVLAFFFIAFSTIFYAMRGQLRHALSNFIVSMFIFLIGLATIAIPNTIASAPVAATNSMMSCISGVLTGDNCFTGGKTTSGSSDAVISSEEMCKSSASNVGTSESLKLRVNSLNCSIWKAFVFEPYAQMSFGRSLSELDTSDPAMTELLKKAKIPANKFDVNLTTTTSLSDTGDTLKLDSGPKVSNLAVYQIFLNTRAESGGSKFSANDDGYDKRWYNVITVAANDADMWNSWSFSFGNFFRQLLLAMLSIITSFLGSLIIIAVSLLANAYLLIVYLMVALLPLFALIGIPEQTRSSFFGWFESLLGNLLKYLFSAVFVFLTITMYGAVMANIENIASAFLFVLILSAALWLYRHEVIGMLSRVNVGGKRMSNAFSDRVNRSLNSTGRAASSVVGGAVGSGMANSFSPRSMVSGGADAAKTAIKRRRGFMGDIARQVDRSSQDNLRDTKHKADIMGRKAEKLEGTADSLAREHQDVVDEMGSNRVEYDESAKESGGYEDAARLAAEVKHTVRLEFGDMPGAGAALNVADIDDQMEDLKAQSLNAKAKGDFAKANGIDAQLIALQQSRQDALDGMNDDERELYDRMAEETSAKLKNNGLNDTIGDNAKLMALKEKMDALAVAHKAAAFKANEMASRANQAQVEAAEVRVQADTLSDAYLDWQPGQVMTSNDVASVSKEAEDKKQYVDRYENLLDNPNLAHKARRVVNDDIKAKSIYDGNFAPVDDGDPVVAEESATGGKKGSGKGTGAGSGSGGTQDDFFDKIAGEDTIVDTADTQDDKIPSENDSRLDTDNRKDKNSQDWTNNKHKPEPVVENEETEEIPPVTGGDESGNGTEEVRNDSNDESPREDDVEDRTQQTPNRESRNEEVDPKRGSESQVDDVDSNEPRHDSQDTPREQEDVQQNEPVSNAKEDTPSEAKDEPSFAEDDSPVAEQVGQQSPAEPSAKEESKPSPFEKSTEKRERRQPRRERREQARQEREDARPTVYEASKNVDSNSSNSFTVDNSNSFSSPREEETPQPESEGNSFTNTSRGAGEERVDTNRKNENIIPRKFGSGENQ